MTAYKLYYLYTLRCCDEKHLWVAKLAEGASFGSYASLGHLKNFEMLCLLQAMLKNNQICRTNYGWIHPVERLNILINLVSFSAKARHNKNIFWCSNEWRGKTLKKTPSWNLFRFWDICATPCILLDLFKQTCTFGFLIDSNSTLYSVKWIKNNFMVRDKFGHPHSYSKFKWLKLLSGVWH